MRALVTGGAGFVGSHVAEALLDRGDEVWVVDNLASGKRENVPDGAQLEEVDIRGALEQLFREVRPDVCFHLAAQADVITSVEQPVYDAEVNVLGTVRVLQAAGTQTQVVFSSTGGAMYGECERPAREDDPKLPLSPYGAAKLAGEEYLAAWNRLSGTSHVSLRLGNVYGPRQEAGLEGGVVAIFLERMAAGEETFIYGDGRQVRDFVHAGDVARAMLAAAGRNGGVYNVGTGVATPIFDLHALCTRVTGYQREPTFAPPRRGDLQRSVLDPTLAERHFGWRPDVPLEEGVQATWEWVIAR
jgi:UDP-glucose 4-epimerase